MATATEDIQVEHAAQTLKPIRVLSMQVSGMGHSTFGRLLRRHFADSLAVTLDSYWLNEDRELSARVLCRLLDYTLPGKWAEERHLDLRRFRRELGASYLARRLAVRRLTHERYDMLHFHTQATALLSIGLMNRTPTVISGDMTAKQVAREWPHARSRVTFVPGIRREERAFQAAHTIVFWSEWAAKSAREEYRIDPHKVHVVYPGVDLPAFPYVQKNPVQQAGPVKFLFVGGDFVRKGGQDVLDVFLQSFSSEAELHLVTNAPVDCSHPRVFLHRNVQAYSEEWFRVYREADIFVLPTHQEAFGLVFLEAMAAGLPVIATDIAAIPEIVDEGKSGLLVPSGDHEALAAALRSLVGDPETRIEMGRRGRGIVEDKFDAARNFQKLETVFRAAASIN